MPLYAVDNDDLISATDAETGKIYWCSDCFGPVKKRQGKHRFPHFYHLKSAPTCRLYSKTDDHMLAQIQLQKAFPPTILQLERPFAQINRVADLCWEKEKIIFEIQCSPMTEIEAASRIRDYASIGYHVVWLLDDKRYNKRVLRPAENYLRHHCTYYLSIQPGLTSKYYDQFEIFAAERRVKKSRPLPLDLQNIRPVPKTNFDPALFPNQILNLQSRRYFLGDRLDRALHNHTFSMQKWRQLEIDCAKKLKRTNPWRIQLHRWILRPYANLLQRLIAKVR